MGSVSTFHTTNSVKLAAIRAANERGIPVTELCEHLLIRHLESLGYVEPGAGGPGKRRAMGSPSGPGGPE
jgi:hypothetical protein